VQRSGGGGPCEAWWRGRTDSPIFLLMQNTRRGRAPPTILRSRCELRMVPLPASLRSAHPTKRNRKGSGTPEIPHLVTKAVTIVNENVTK
jgi:hypothetical protein